MADNKTDKIDAFINDFETTAAQIKAAQKVQRGRQASVKALMETGLVSDEQSERLAALLPKKREPKDDK